MNKTITSLYAIPCWTDKIRNPKKNQSTAYQSVKILETVKRVTWVVRPLRLRACFRLNNALIRISGWLFFWLWWLWWWAINVLADFSADDDTEHLGNNWQWNRSNTTTTTRTSRLAADKALPSGGAATGSKNRISRPHCG
jgi:hypothetical protein